MTARKKQFKLTRVSSVASSGSFARFISPNGSPNLPKVAESVRYGTNKFHGREIKCAFPVSVCKAPEARYRILYPELIGPRKESVHQERVHHVRTRVEKTCP